MKNAIQISALYLLLCFIVSSCQQEAKDSPVFQLLDSGKTNIDFENTIQESDSFNMYTFMNLYTGGGVAIGDINNDGLEDIFFSGNRVPAKLYLNKGNLSFEDISEKAGLNTNRWCAGASMVDLNNDGLLDIYISVSGVGTDEQRSNLFFENQGDLTFQEKAADYGLNDARQVMHTSFFDYDKDGDLDAYMIVNPVNYSLANVNHVKPKITDGSDESTDRLYRNDGGKFIDVSQESGILIGGYSLGIATCDINGDDWPDIYVSNDFLTNDILYTNNQDGTFTNRAGEYLDHTSFAGMGNDVSDFNNDGLPDIMVADMLPEDNQRRQLIIPASSYDKFQLPQQMDYEPQYTRNTLQLNNGDGSFSEIGQLAGIDKTDWSWSSLFADYDNDGDKDLFVTNGFLRDVGNLDYISYQRANNATPFGDQKKAHQKRLEAIQNLGAAKIYNYVFENQGDLTFDKKTKAWGIDQKTCSNGAAFADLDNDGDLEMIVNNVNDRAFIYENKTNELKQNHFIKIKLNGSKENPQGLGTKISLTTKAGNQQFYEQNPYRGYESTVSQVVHFGLGDIAMIETLEIQWPDGKKERLQNIKANQTLDIFYKNAQQERSLAKAEKAKTFLEVSPTLGLDFLHQEKEFVDFKIQPLLPHKHSQNGPGIAVGDVNGDGLEDCYIGGSAGFAGQLFIQTEKGFVKKVQDFDAKYEDMAALFFDADNDTDMDLYIVSGGSDFMNDPKMYQDRLYQNDGEGNFMLTTMTIPLISASGSIVNAADFDKDGDLDLFVGGRIVPGAYPMPARSLLLRNDSKNGQIAFTDISKEQLPNEGKIGLVTSALWTDFDNDDWLDLMIAGEWMPLQFLKNQKGALRPDASLEIPNSSGWWNSLVAADFDKDGDMDYIAGNLGLNSRHQASPDRPLCVYTKDYDKNGRMDPIFCQYINEERYLAHPRDLLIQQINAMRVRFKTYETYGTTPFEKSFTKKELEDAYVLKTEHFASSYLENMGDGTFKMTPLPIEAQIAPVYGMSIDDFDRDGNMDVILVGNSYATEVAIGRYDAFKGLLLSGEGTGHFESKKANETGFMVDRDAKGLSRIYNPNNEALYVVTRNADSLTIFKQTDARPKQIINLASNDQYLMLQNKDGKWFKQEACYGAAYLSQSSRRVSVGADVTAIEIINIKGERRKVKLLKDSIDL